MSSDASATRNFLIFFEEKEGSTAMVRLLNMFPQVSVVRRETGPQGGGWEPFEWFSCGSLPRNSFSECLDLIYRQRPLDLQRLNKLYTKLSRSPIAPFDASGSVGFKMRMRPPWDIPNLHADSPLRNYSGVQLLASGARRWYRTQFRDFMIRRLAELDVVTFVTVRQDVFRWAVSKYHGDGTGKPGHLQFRVASGSLRTSEIPRIRIDPRKFEQVIAKCEHSHDLKRSWVEQLRSIGVRAYPLRYEQFLNDRVGFFSDVLAQLGISTSHADVTAKLSDGISLQRVHGSDLSQYVENHEEITARFGHRFVAW